MYSTDRKKQLSYTMNCLRNMDLYESCQRTLVVDGKIDEVFPDWDFVQVPRIGGNFCWANMWDAGVETAQHDVILYLDSDRLLPRNYLSLLHVKDGEFIFTSKHFQMLRYIDFDKCDEFLTRSDSGVFVDDSFLGAFRYEPRNRMPVHGPGKNVMSGNTAFTKETYRTLGGVDPWYRGHGAYADTDFHFKAALGGCRFRDLQVPELHLPHDKLEEKLPLSEMELWKKGIDNFLYYCQKWSLPLVLVENVVSECGIKNPSKYVDKRLQVLDLPPRD
jgi:hypothetical protein